MASMEGEDGEIEDHTSKKQDFEVLDALSPSKLNVASTAVEDGEDVQHTPRKESSSRRKQKFQERNFEVLDSLSPSKILKPNVEFNDTDFKKFLMNKNLVNELMLTFESMCYQQTATTISPLRILNCDGADEVCGVRFKNAYASVKRISSIHFFASIFRKGMDMLGEFLHTGTIPEQEQDREIFRKLIAYFLNQRLQAPLLDLKMYSDTELPVVLTNHLISKLSSISSLIIMDKDKYTDVWRRGCPCRTEGCRLEGNVGDTGVGCEDVWHGSLDAIINDELILCQMEQPVEKLTENPQLIAQTIVFSFLQKKRNPRTDKCLYPCIAIGQEKMLILFYDSKNDMLLQSSHIPLFLPSPGPDRLHMCTIIVAWLVVNYKSLSLELTDALKEAPKSQFFDRALGKMNTYRHRLKLGGIGNTMQKNEDGMARGLSVRSDTFLENWRQKIMKHRQDKNTDSE